MIRVVVVRTLYLHLRFILGWCFRTGFRSTDDGLISVSVRALCALRVGDIKLVNLGSFEALRGLNSTMIR
jgi:hypothetical protein